MFVRSLVRQPVPIKGIFIRFSDIREIFFDAVRFVGWKLEGLKLYACSIDDNFTHLLSRIDYSLINVLSLKGNPIGNKGVERLMKLRMPDLRTLKIYQSNITTDVIKVLNKKVGLFDYLGIMYKNKINNVSLLKDYFKWSKGD